MSVSRFPWNEFPDAWLHADESEVKRHPAYGPAKGGDLDAAYLLVEAFANPEAIAGLAGAFNRRQPILVSAHAVERGGVNAIPEALADHLGSHLGWQVDSEIVQTNVVGHTGADGFTRMARQAEFDGRVEAGRNDCLVDDFVGQGGTLANMRGMLIAGGGIVVGATALTGKPYSAKLNLEVEILKQLREKYGNELENWWNERFGFGDECLTNSEGRYRLRTPTFDRIRDRIAAAVEG